VHPPTILFPLCSFIDLDEPNGVQGLASDFELHKPEAAAVIRIFRGIVIGVLDSFAFFHSEQFAHVFQVAGIQQFLELRIGNLLRERLVHFDLARFTRELECVNKDEITPPKVPETP
jgi:hypothetical protein